MEYWIEAVASVRFSARELDHLGPFLGFVGNKFPEFGRRHWHRHIRKVGEPFPRQTMR
jgi:hypothetical protein